MRAGIALIARPPADPQRSSGLQWLIDIGTIIEKLGFAGIWVTAEAREGLQRLAAISFDDVLLLVSDRSEHHLNSVRALIP